MQIHDPAACLALGRVLRRTALPVRKFARSAGKTALLIVAGTTGSANLPNQVVSTVLRRGAAIIDINPDFNIFSETAQRSPGGLFLQGGSAAFLPMLADLIKDRIAAGS